MIAFSKQAKNLEATQKTEDQASESSSTTHTPQKTTDGETNTLMTPTTTTNLTQTETVTTNLLESSKEKFIFVEIYKVDSEDVLNGLDSLE